ncbi:L-cystine transporter [Polychytrium aggregatum]|uniref:L-cystine transporter n=1 Tax=Polychytrium aggregatum TaxID=110093 RepID=UPI0022FEB5A8|nr:L-cystine transporter [Polychytrium aggregatum]KAI9203550.1 L-cystine transporter [Polychytrium aggregatum]
MAQHGEGLERISALLGWGYFVAWSASFYPQLLLNYRRKSVTGLSFDFLALNFIGFTCYSLYNVIFFASPLIRDQYKNRWGSENLVGLNDVCFSVHAFLALLVGISQALVYERHPSQRVHRPVWIFFYWSLAGLGVVLLGTAVGYVLLLDVVYYLSYVKMATSLLKYTPQAYLNYRRQSTIGYSIGGILLDFAGGIMSITQLVLDAYISGNWNGIIGNPIKLGLGLTSLAFNVIFMVQHYVLYTQREVHSQDEVRLLLETDGP